MNQDRERAPAQQELLSAVVSVREVLGYLEADRFMDLKEAAEYLPLSERTIREHLNEIPHFRCGRKLVFRRSEIDRWMEGFRVTGKEVDEALELAEEMLA
ncbi:MAG: helix-turn-helix domain-containing protein [Acidobacteria bacterium]|nr:helix-turn-helix domain-containing protein [Acidobacteriota bacterium]